LDVDMLFSRKELLHPETKVKAFGLPGNSVFLITTYGDTGWNTYFVQGSNQSLDYIKQIFVSVKGEFGIPSGYFLLMKDVTLVLVIFM